MFSLNCETRTKLLKDFLSSIVTKIKCWNSAVMPIGEADLWRSRSTTAAPNKVAFEFHRVDVALDGQSSNSNLGNIFWAKRDTPATQVFPRQTHDAGVVAGGTRNANHAPRRQKRKARNMRSTNPRQIYFRRLRYTSQWDIIQKIRLSWLPTNPARPGHTNLSGGPSRKQFESHW